MLEDAIKYLIALGGYNTVDGPTERYPSKVVAVPDKSRLESMERFQAQPNRIEHIAALDSSGAFAGYVNRFKGESTSIYLSIFDGDPSFTAVLDHHDPKQPSWNGHKARFVPRISMEWKAWTTLYSEGDLTQAELLAFFEDHANDLYEPTPSRMLGHLNKFESVEKHTYQSAQNLDNGNVSITYIKDGGQRKVEFPHTLKLHIPVLENEEAIFIEGRLRYKTAEGSILFTFQFKQDPARIHRDTLRRLAGEIKDKTGVHCYEGRVLK